MRLKLQHIAVIVAAFFTTVSCFRDEAEVIPRSKMAKIYAEMLVTDQWINSNPSVRKIADTSLVYQPVLEKYGYDLDDYLASVDRYMDDPERFSRIMREAGDIIEKRIKVLEAELDKQKKAQEREQRIKDMTIEADFSPEEFFPYLFDEPYVHYYDSLVVEIDSVIAHYRFRDVPTTDTLYDGVRMLLKLDTLALKDSLSVRDSLAVADSIAAADSMFKAAALKAAIATRRETMAVEDSLVETEILFDEPPAKSKKRNNKRRER